MRRSEYINELAAALAKAQAEIKDAEKDKQNPHFKSTYATLASVWAACRGPLSKNGLSIIQSPSTTENSHVLITTLLLHASGQWIEDELALTPAQNTPQGFGSAITYGRRYALMSMAGTAPGDESDDDANAASAAPARRAVSTTVPVQPKNTSPQPIVQATVSNPVTEERNKKLQEAVSPFNWPAGSVGNYCVLAYGTAKISELSEMQFQTLLMVIKNQTAAQAKAALAEHHSVAESGAAG